jgi:hypothetical protein
MNSLRRVAAAAGLWVAIVLTGAADAPPGMTATSSLDRPAMWVADRITFTVEVRTPRGFDILLEDLGRDRLKTNGLDVLDSETAREPDGDGTKYVVRFVLTTYKIDVPTPSIAAFPVRYYVTRAGQRPAEASPAGSVMVPGAALAFRSLLLDDQPSDVRDGRAIPPRWAPYRVLEPVGIGLMLLAAAPVLFLTLDLMRRARARRPATARPSPRQVRLAARAALNEIRAIDPAAADARRLAFARLDAVVRQHVADVCNVPIVGLTPDEIAPALDGCAGRIPAELVAAILTTCELAGYAAPASQPSAEDWRAALTQAEQLLTARRS